MPALPKGSRAREIRRNPLPWPRLALAGLLLVLPRPAGAGEVQLLTRSDPGFRSDTASGASVTSPGPSMSGDGRYLVFFSTAPNLAPGQVEGPSVTSDVFLFDRVTGARTLVSHNAGSANTAGNGPSYSPVLSADGRWVAFLSAATDLVAGQSDANGGADVFLYDRLTGTTVLASRAGASPTTTLAVPSASLALSADGGDLAFATDPGTFGTQSSVYLFDRAAGATTLVSHSAASPTVGVSGRSDTPSISADGSFVAFESSSTALVAGVSYGQSGENVFLYDRAAGTNSLVSHAAGSPATAMGGEEPSISADGSSVAFLSFNNSANANVYLFNRVAGTVVLVSHVAGQPAIPGNGDGSSLLVSADGSAVAYLSQAGNLIDGIGFTNAFNSLFLWSRASGTNVLVSHVAGSATTPTSAGADLPALSADGSLVAFVSGATDLLPTPPPTPGTHLFLYAPSPATTTLVTGAYDFDGPALSADGSAVAFTTIAFLPGVRDDNGTTDVGLYTPATASFQWVSLRDPGLPAVTGRIAGFEAGASVSLSADASVVALQSPAVDLAAGQDDVNLGATDLFLVSRPAGTTTLVSRRAGTATTTADGEVFGAQVSADGHSLVFATDSDDLVSGMVVRSFENLFLYDPGTGTTTLLTHAFGAPLTTANANSQKPAVSADGRYVAFLSLATDLLPSPIDSRENVFLLDRATGTVTLVSHAAGMPGVSANDWADSSQSPALSADGRYVAYGSRATNLVPGQSGSLGNVFLFDRVAGTTALVSHASGSDTTAVSGGGPAISADGRWVAFLDGSYPQLRLWLWDRTTGALTLVSHAAGAPGTPADGGVLSYAMSADGHALALASTATNLLAGAVATVPQVYFYDRITDSFSLASHAAGLPDTPAAAGAGDLGSQVALSADGSRLAFASADPALVPGQSGSGTARNVFLYDRATGGLALVSHAPGSPTAGGNGNSDAIEMSHDGGFVAFVSDATNLVVGDYNQRPDAFLYAADFPGRAFFTLTPCRLLDTRQPAQGPPLASGVKRVLAVHGACGIPATARAIALNVTVTGGTAAGHLTLFPGDTGLPATSTLNFAAGQTRANNALLPLSLAGDGTLALTSSVLSGGTVQVIVDVSGWFE